MPMLDRYRRSGGFLQLLALLETCDHAKQERFLDIIRIEDARWAEAIQTKMLNIDKIYQWPDEPLAEIVGRLQDLTLAVAIIAAPPPIKAKIHQLCSHSRWRKLEEVIDTTKPTHQEISTTNMKVIETVRAMVKEGLLRFEKIEPSLIIEEKIEDKLSKATSTSSQDSHQFDAKSETATNSSTATASVTNLNSDHSSNSGSPGATTEYDRAELIALRKKHAENTKEIAFLRQENSTLRHRLEQIRKIA
jgi:hypothetical protein